MKGSMQKAKTEESRKEEERLEPCFSHLVNLHPTHSHSVPPDG